jgi:hypothetical protein
MYLDMMTMSAVAITVTAILGFVLVFNWARQGACPSSASGAWRCSS